jgi:hypothetical protein
VSPDLHAQTVHQHFDASMVEIKRRDEQDPEGETA